MLKKGVIPIPPARSTAGFAEVLCSVKEPVAGSTFTAVPIGIAFKDRLKAVSRMRVANISRSSNGALAIENVRTFPSESVSGGFTNVRSEDHQCQVGGLPGSEFESRRLLEMEGHGILRDFNSI